MPAFNILHIAQAAALPNPGQREIQGPTEGRQGNPQHRVPGNPTPRVQSPGLPEPRPSLDEKGAHSGLGCQQEQWRAPRILRGLACQDSGSPTGATYHIRLFTQRAKPENRAQGSCCQPTLDASPLKQHSFIYVPGTVLRVHKTVQRAKDTPQVGF